MKTTLKITPGPWELVDVSTGSATVKQQVLHNGYAAMMLQHDGSEEGFANAALIAEAGTVANETGLTPRQLAEDRAKLLEACNLALADYEEMGCEHDPVSNPDPKNCACCALQHAIASAERGIK